MNESDRILLRRVRGGGGGGWLSPNLQQGYVPPMVCDPYLEHVFVFETFPKAY